MGLDMYIEVNGHEEIYMRKANAIRRWFAENLDNFEDNGRTNIPKEKYEKLLKVMYDTICKGGIRNLYMNYVVQEDVENEDVAIVSTEEGLDLLYDTYKMVKEFVNANGTEYKKFCKRASKMFPTQDGFFFGDTSYGVSYIWDLIIFYYRLTELYDILTDSDEEWKDDTVQYLEWY